MYLGVATREGSTARPARATGEGSLTAFLAVVERCLLKDMRDLKTVALLGLCCLVLPLSFASSVLLHKQHRAEYQARQGAGRGLVLCPRPPGVLAAGVESTQYGSGTGGYLGSSGVFDPLFVVRVILSLVAILLGASSVREESAGGLLRLLFAGPLARSTYILGRLASGLLVLLCSFVVAMLAGIVVLLLSGLSPTPAEWTAMTLIGTIEAAYLSLFYVAGLALAVLLTPTGLVTNVALATWVVVVVVLPGTVAAGVSWLWPVASAENVAHERFRIRNESLDTTRPFAESAETHRLIAEVDSRWSVAMDRQADMGATVLASLPGGALTIAATTLANTGLGYFRSGVKPTMIAGGEDGAALAAAAAKGRRGPLLLPVATIAALSGLCLLLCYLAFVRKPL